MFTAILLAAGLLSQPALPGLSLAEKGFPLLPLEHVSEVYVLRMDEDEFDDEFKGGSRCNVYTCGDSHSIHKVTYYNGAIKWAKGYNSNVVGDEFDDLPSAKEWCRLWGMPICTDRPY